MDINRIPVGQLDAVIAEKVMGLRVVREPAGFSEGEFDVWRDAAGHKHSEGHPPRYSTDIAAAWQVVEKMAPIWGKKFRLSFDDGEWELEPAWNSPVCGHGKTPALAICRAAVKLIENGA